MCVPMNSVAKYIVSLVSHVIKNICLNIIPPLKPQGSNAVVVSLFTISACPSHSKFQSICSVEHVWPTFVAQMPAEHLLAAKQTRQSLEPVCYHESLAFHASNNYYLSLVNHAFVLVFV